MSLRELQKRLDKLETRAKSKRLGILPIIESVELDALERWETFTPEERDRYRVVHPDAETKHSTEPLAAIIVSVALPSEEELWRLDFEDVPEPTKAVEPSYEPASPTWETLRDAYVAKTR